MLGNGGVARARRARRAVGHALGVALRALGGVLVLASGAPAAADTLQVQGVALQGRVAGLTPAGVAFEPVYGTGTLVVSFDDLEGLETEGPLSVLHGEQGAAHGRIVGFERGWILVGDDPATAERIEASTLVRAYPDDEFGDSRYEALRSRLRYWTASLDAGGAAVQSTTDTVSAFTGVRLERSRDPTRLLFEGSFRYANEKQKGEPRNVNENVVAGFLRGEYDLTPRVFGFVSHRATYDEDKNLSLRLEPRGGLGAHVLKRSDMTLDADVGIAWIYEDYFGRTPIPGAFPLTRSRGRDDFWTVAFGSAFLWKLPFDATFRASGEYLPAVDAWARNYLLRGQSSLEFPLVEWLSFKLAAIEEHDSTPAEGNGRNKLTLTAGLALRF